MSITLLDGVSVTISAPAADVEVSAPTTDVTADNAPNVIVQNGGGSGDISGQLSTSTTPPTPAAGDSALWLEPVAGGKFKLKAVTGV